MTSFCFLLLGAIASFIISRMIKSTTMYVYLVFVLLLGFVVGTGVKSAVANAQDTPSQKVVVTAVNSMLLASSPAVVKTEDEHTEVMYTELTGDTVVTNNETLPTTPYTCEIEDDS